MATLATTVGWQSVTLTQNELWQADGEICFVTTDATQANGRNGMTLKPTEVLNFNNGDTVYFASRKDCANGIKREPRA